MHNHILLTLLLLIKVFPQIKAQCGETIYTDKDFLTCSSSHQLDSSMAEFPSFLRTHKASKLSVDIIFNPVSACTSATSLLDLFIVSIKDPTGQENKVIDFYWSNNGFYQIYTAVGTNTLPIAFTATTDFATNNWLEMIAFVDFENQYFTAGVNIPGSFNFQSTSSFVSFYSSALAFDVNTKFYFCSIDSGASFKCSIKSLNIWYTYTSGIDGLSYYGSLSPVLAAYYRMDEFTGSIISDASGTLSKGTFGTPATNKPTWSSKIGVEFTTANQYIELPVFSTTSSGSPLASESFTISFWLKFASATGTANIFRYSTSLLDHDNFGLYIDGAGFLRIEMGNGAYPTTATTPISPSVWTLITASYNIYKPAYKTSNLVFLYKDQTRIAFNSFYSLDLINFASSPFRVIIGGPSGFLGTISHLRIFSPATNHVHDLTGCSASSSSYGDCAINLVTSDPLTCISYPCGGPNCDQCSGSAINSCLSCSRGYDYYEDLSLCTRPEDSTSPVTKPAQTTVSALAKVYNVLTKGSSAFSAAIAGKIFSNIKYLDIGYSYELQNALKYWKSSFISIGLDLDPPQGLQDHAPELGVPPTFEKYDVSSDFLINFWEGIIVLLFMAALFGVIRAIEHFTKESKHRILPKIRKARFMLQNLLNSQLYGVFADVVMFAVLNYRTQSLGEGLASLGFFLSALLLIITAFVLAFELDLLVQYQRLKTNKNALEEFLERSQGSSIIFEDFKDTSLLRQSFLFLLVLRDFLFSLILTTIFEKPLAQTILILVLNLAMIALLLYIQPFKERFGFLQQIFYEIVTLAVNVSVIILAAKDNADLEAYDFRQSTGKFIIITNLVFNFTVIAFLLCGLIMAAKEAYREYKAKKAEKTKKVAPLVVATSFQSESSQLVYPQRPKEIDLKYNQTITLTSEPSLKRRNGRSREWPMGRISEPRFANDACGNQLCLDNLPELQGSSLVDMQRKMNKHSLNKRENHPLFLQEQQQNLRNSSNLGDGNQNLQREMYSQKQSLNYFQKQTAQRGSPKYS